MARLSARPRAVFLDRDGTLNVRAADHDYVRTAADFRWLDGAAEAVGVLDRAGYVPFVVSNQRGVARGLMTADVLTEIEDVMQAALARHGTRIEAFRYCVHDLEPACACRKPEPGMLLDLAAEHDLDLGASWMVGDTAGDVEAGRRAGTRTGFVGEPAADPGADLRAATLLELAALIGSASAVAGRP